jgi:peptide-methionine (S)-S-oxide reductase
MKYFLKTICLPVLLATQLAACGQTGNSKKTDNSDKMNESNIDTAGKNLEVATFAGGCFWCVEAQYQELQGVEKVESGYTGGTLKNPSYKEVCSGRTGHAEAVNIYYDPKVISYDELLAAFWVAHDPTQLNRQGNDVGTQYRSAIFYHNEEQKKKAEEYKRKLNEEKAYDSPVVTEIMPFTVFYKAEDYHQNYYNENPEQAYCHYVIQPKKEKFEKIFKDKLKKQASH